MKESVTKQLGIEQHLLQDFLDSRDTLRVYNDNQLLFTSDEDGLKPLMEYLDKNISIRGEIKIFDTIFGNAAALLAIKAGCKRAYSPLGSRLAINTLDVYGISYNFSRVVPCIQNRKGKGICPMESLSIGKNPEEFYALMRQLKEDE